MPKKQNDLVIRNKRQSTQENTLITIKEKEFAHLVGLSIANLQRRRKRGEVEHLRVGRRILYVIPDHINSFIKHYSQPMKSIQD